MSKPEPKPVASHAAAAPVAAKTAAPAPKPTPPISTGSPSAAQPSPAPTLGRIVHYRLGPTDAASINKRRDSFKASKNGWTGGPQAHVGNHAAEGNVYPMVVVGIHGPNCVNGQVLLDGNDTLWVTSASESDKNQGCWFWPPRS
jgi:hypothetical protein